MGKYHGKRYYLGAWNYVLLSILYCIPVIGLICLILHSFNEKDENRLHYARSYFARLLVVVILCGVFAGVLYLTAGKEAFEKERWEAVTDSMQDFRDSVRDLFAGGSANDAAEKTEDGTLETDTKDADPNDWLNEDAAGPLG